MPRQGLMREWVHRLPPGAEEGLLFQAWFDPWLTRRDTRVLETPEPVPPLEPIDYGLPVLPTEWVFERGHRIVLVLSHASPDATLWPQTAPPSSVSIDGEASALDLPVLDTPGDASAPRSAGPYQRLY